MLQQVKVKNWVDGKEGDMLNGMTATFGSFLPEDADQTHKAPLLYAIPNDCCSLSTSKVFLIYTSINSIFIMFSHSFIHSFIHIAFQLSGSAAVCVRGNCDYTTKAAFAQSGGATAVVMINDRNFPTFHSNQMYSFLHVSLPSLIPKHLPCNFTSSHSFLFLFLFLLPFTHFGFTLSYFSKFYFFIFSQSSIRWTAPLILLKR